LTAINVCARSCPQGFRFLSRLGSNMIAEKHVKNAPRQQLIPLSRRIPRKPAILMGIKAEGMPMPLSLITR
jgi:hypothetical protein